MSSVRICAAFPLLQLLSARPAQIPALESNNQGDEAQLPKGGIMTTLLMTLVFVALLLAICHAASAACEVSILGSSGSPQQRFGTCL